MASGCPYDHALLLNNTIKEDNLFFSVDMFALPPSMLLQSMPGYGFYEHEGKALEYGCF